MTEVDIHEYWLRAPLVTARLTLRATGPEDEGFIRRLFTNGEGRAFVGGALTPEEAERRIVITERRWGHFAIELSGRGETIGTISCAEARGKWDLSFQLARAFWGCGFASEAGLAVVRWFYEAKSGDDEVLHADAQLANSASIAVLKRLGGREVDRWFRNGKEVVGFEIPRVGPSARRPPSP